jgi:hypothetical protein
MGESTSNEGSATTDGNALPRDNAFQGDGCQAGAGAPRAGTHGAAVSVGSGQRRAPPDQHRLPLPGKQLLGRSGSWRGALELEEWALRLRERLGRLLRRESNDEPTNFLVDNLSPSASAFFLM